MDPESGLDAVRHVGIRGTQVAAISETPLAGREVVDVSGLVVAPGFIDLHVHGQDPLSWDFMARDGVTTALSRRTNDSRPRRSRVTALRVAR
jgi:N-acyl-D-aspartate/D-glutamate deacylase